MERKYVELADGRQVRRGPWFERNEVGIYVISETMLQEHGKQWGDCITILEIKIPADYFIGTLALPEIKIINKELWTEDLLAEVVRVLRQSTEDEKMLDHGETRVLCEKSSAYKKSIEYIITKLSGMFKEEKKLILEDGRRLIGDLELKLGWDEESSAGYNTLQILGNIEDPKTGITEKTAILTIKHLYILLWPGPDKDPIRIKNSSIWCKKVESLVINYLNLLADFASAPLDSQISGKAKELARHNEWTIKCRKIFQKLSNFGLDEREDPRIIRAFELIDQVGRI